MGVSDLAEQFFTLKQKKDELKGKLKEIEDQLNAVQSEMLEELSHEGLSRIDLTDKASFHVATRKFFKVADREEFLDFLHDQGDTDILSVNHNTLNAYAKEILTRKEADGIEDYQIPGVSFFEKPHIRMRKASR